jgi:solute carrier family 25 2-oxodicarboxylate transporter 21
MQNFIHFHKLKGLNRGLTSTLGRNGVWNMIYFGFYHNIRPYIPKTDVKKNLTILKRINNLFMVRFSQQNKTTDYTYRVLSGFVAGSIASTINIPFDVAKSRIQGFIPEGTPRKYHTCFQSILLVYREEGAKALFKGLIPKLLRLGPGKNLNFIIYVVRQLFDFLFFTNFEKVAQL